MVSNQQNLNQVGIGEFLRALRIFGVKENDISGKPLKIKYSNVAPYSTQKRHYTPTKYEDEEEDDNDEKEFRQPSLKHQIHKVKKTSSSSLVQRGKGYVHKPPGRKPNILYVY